MNVDIWFLFKYFWGLPITGKITMVAGFILLILLIILWETIKAQRHDAKESPTATSYSIIKSTEQHIHTVSAYSDNGNLRKHHNMGVIWRYLLETFRNSLRKYHIDYEPNNDGDSPTHPVQWHINNIVNKLRGLVNQSGKEPAELFKRHYGVYPDQMYPGVLAKLARMPKRERDEIIIPELMKMEELP